MNTVTQPRVLHSEWTKVHSLRSSRITLLVAVGLVVGLGLLACLIAFLAGQAIFASRDVDASLGDPGVLRAVLGAGLFLTGIGALGVGLGALIRNSAGAIATLTGLLFVAPVIVSVLPERWSDAIGPYLPGQAGIAVIFTQPSPDSLGPWTGLGVLGLWAAVAGALAAVMLMRRD